MTSPILTLSAYNGFGHEVAVDVTRATHWERIDFNGNPGLVIHLDTGKEVRVDDSRFDVARRLVAIKDALLREHAVANQPRAFEPVITAAAAAIVRQLSHESHEALDRDLVMAVCTYVMEQSAQ